MGSRLLRPFALAVVVVLVLVWVVVLRPASLGGPATYVIVSGESMEPTLRSNDFVAAFEQDAYEVGDVVVYRVPAADQGAGVNIVHRIVGGSALRGFVVRGDNREGADRWRPRADEILGKVRVTVPHAGRPLLFVRTAAGLAILAGLVTLLVALGLTSRKPS